MSKNSSLEFQSPIADLRQDYTKSDLLESNVNANPFKQFEVWFNDAKSGGILEPNAMSLGVSDKEGNVSVRVVLLKEVNERGFVFFTNYESTKGSVLVQNPKAGLCFFWDKLERQITITGYVEKISREESETYFKSRPLGSQLGAWASQQSCVIPNREFIETKLKEVETKYADGNVPVPPYWGGFVVIPSSIEFWQGRSSRLHDRLIYTQENNTWVLRRLSP